MKKMEAMAIYRKIPSQGSYEPPRYQLFVVSYDRKNFPFKGNPGPGFISVKGPDEKLKVYLTHEELNELERL